MDEALVKRVLKLLDVYAPDTFDLEMAATVTSVALEANQQVIETLRSAVEAAYHEGWSDRISYRATDPEASADDGWTFSEARAALTPTQPEPTRGETP